MKRTKKVVALGLCLPLFLGLAACQQNNTSTEATNQTQTSSDKVPWTASYSNLNGQVSTEEVKSFLSAHLDPNSVEAFFNLVTAYNATVGSTGLSGDFTSFTKTEYDVEKISNLWNQKKGDFVGTNCRINSYALLKNSVTIPKLEKNDQLLFVDNDAIDKGKVFDVKDKEEFDILFSRVETEATTDVKVHAQKMEKFFSQFQFNDKALMLSVVLHDNLDGEFLFVGHVGVLVPAEEGFLFVEKLTFEEPYQAIKFESKEDCYKYLATKYADYTGDGLAKPFIMDNEKLVEGY
ncbi:DUF4300 family protein [Streptococcus sp.]|uniref:DUF4300 family protein n=1 Tax=Streptococcus sp. TaxID=1306 RepID=UPI0026DAFAF2|nr:DUF4300 family protein [Streptococcus sp.]MDO4660404.1 DUF4300 family protein [Streptococcus sp.]